MLLKHCRNLCQREVFWSFMQPNSFTLLNTLCLPGLIRSKVKKKKKQHRKKTVLFKSHTHTFAHTHSPIGVVTACHAYIWMKQITHPSHSHWSPSFVWQKIPWRLCFVKYMHTVWVSLENSTVTHPPGTVRGRPCMCLWKLRFDE